jgi:hypothetical protein
VTFNPCIVVARGTRRGPADLLIPLLLGIVAVIAAILMTYSVRIVATSYIQTVFYDEWKFIRDLAETDGSFPPFKYLFAAHNEHVIATYRILQWIDFKLFDLTHGLIIVITLATQILNGYLFARIVCVGLCSPSILKVLTLAAAGLALSLAQWENLLAAFQVAFPIELMGALATSFLVATPIPTGAGGGACWWIGLTAAFAIAVCSLGSGIAVPVTGVLTLAVLRRRVGVVSAAAAIGITMIGLFLAETWTPRLADIAALQAPADLIRFAVCLLGSPFSPDPGVAAPIGVAFLAAWAITVGAIWRSRRAQRLPLDAGFAAITCLSLILLAALAAVTWRRATLGLPSAFSTRYATLTLFLWLCLPGFWLRGLLLSSLPQLLQRKLALIPLSCIVAAAAWSGLRPDHLANIELFRSKVETGGYFMASGAMADAEASIIAPWRPMLEPALTFLRDRRLNVFSSRWAAQSPTAEQVGRLGVRGALPTCPEGSIDRSDRLERDVWAVTGWITDRNRREVQIVFASDGAGRLLGLTRPLEPRQDINRTLGLTAGIHGFKLPIVRTAERDADVMIVALAVPESASCSLGASPTLPP